MPKLITAQMHALIAVAIFLTAVSVTLMPSVSLGIINESNPLFGNFTVSDFVLLFALLAGAVDIGTLILMLSSPKKIHK